MFETLVGLDVADEEAYAAYRAEMTPILESYGGSFRFDATIAKTLRSELPHAVNRLFVIGFPDASTRDRFFADPAYLRVKAARFAPAVRHVAVLAEYVR